MRETFTGISKNEDYSLLGNNCVTTVQRTLEAVGLHSYIIKEVSYRVANRSLGESSYNVTVRSSHSLRLNSTFRAIIKNNQEYYIHRKK